MTEEKWDGDAFRRSMKRLADNANRYSEQHSDRLRQGRPDGSASYRDEYRGETALYDYLSTSAATESPSALSLELDTLEADDAEDDFIGDKKAFRKGYDNAIARVREQLAD